MRYFGQMATLALKAFFYKDFFLISCSTLKRAAMESLSSILECKLAQWCTSFINWTASLN